MQNWSLSGSGSAGGGADESDPSSDPAKAVPDPAAERGDPAAEQDDPTEWDELAAAGPEQTASPADVLVAGAPLDEPEGMSFDRPAEDTGPTTESAVPDADEPDTRHADHAGQSVLEAAAIARFQARWRDVQFGFVDDPQTSVRLAGDLAVEVLETFTEALNERRSALDDQWRQWRAEHGGPPDTERLRLAVRAYREFVDRLLTT
jgi:hypothetical protein